MKNVENYMQRLMNDSQKFTVGEVCYYLHNNKIVKDYIKTVVRVEQIGCRKEKDDDILVLEKGRDEYYWRGFVYSYVTLNEVTFDEYNLCNLDRLFDNREDLIKSLIDGQKEV